MNRVRILVSFDRENDLDLSERLSAESLRAGSTFEVVKREPCEMSESGLASDTSAAIEASDEVVVICGENTHESILVSLELAMAQEQEKPFMLLWGRREKMCTKPNSARKTDAMFSWTREILESQISATLRDSLPRVVPENCKSPRQKSESESESVPGDGRTR